MGCTSQTQESEAFRWPSQLKPDRRSNRLSTSGLSLQQQQFTAVMNPTVWGQRLALNQIIPHMSVGMKALSGSQLHLHLEVVIILGEGNGHPKKATVHQTKRLCHIGKYYISFKMSILQALISSLFGKFAYGWRRYGDISD